MGSISSSFDDDLLDAGGRNRHEQQQLGRSPPGAYPAASLGQEGGAQMAVEPPLPPPSSSSASSSPTQPTYNWSVPPRGSPELHSSDAGGGLAPTSTLPSLGSPNTPPLVPRDPFDDGANSFAHDPFANDGSDPDDIAREDTPPAPLASSVAGGTAATASSSGLMGGGTVEGGGRARSGTISGLGIGHQGDRMQQVVPPPPAVVAPDAYAYDASSSGSDSEDLQPSQHRPELAPAPVLVRAVSAPVQPARLGNLIHPNRRPSNSSSARPSFVGRPPLGVHAGSSFSASSDSRLLSQHRNSISSDIDTLIPSTGPSPSTSSLSLPLTPEVAHASSGLNVLTLELADSVQAAIQTLLQVTPPHLFDSAKEQFSACSVQMPATSLSSLLTAMKNLNYLSEHIAPLCADDNLQGSPKARSSLPRLAIDPTRSSANTRRTSPTASVGLPPPGPTPLQQVDGTPPASMDSQVSVASEGDFSLVQEFDVGEILQSVGDLMGGLMAEAGVDLVLYHGDVGMKHFSVRGDEGGICYVLSHVIRQILLVSKPGDAIEIGLHVNPQSSDYPRDSVSQRKRTSSSASDSASVYSQLSSSPSGVEAGNALLCTFEITHNVAPRWDELPTRTPMTEKAGTPNQGGGESFPGLTLEAGMRLVEGASAAPEDGGDIETRALLPPLPHLDSPLTNRLIKHVSALLRSEGDRSSIRRRFELSFLLERGSALFDPQPLTAQEEAARQPFASVKLAREPTLAELMVFAETLRGKKVALHASETSAFARHITSYLTSWGMDLRHISTERGDEEYGNEYLGLGITPSDAAASPGVVPSIYSTLPEQHGGRPPFETSPLSQGSDERSDVAANTLSASIGDLDKDAGVSFIMIDDDLEVLKRRLRQLRAQCMTSMPLRMKSKRPTLASRARSSPHIRQLMTPLTEAAAPPKRGAIVVHFTSLANYSAVRDCIQGILSPGGTGALPEVIVIPKPVGPRRFLTALHTAVLRPIVDPFFTPIATSPLSPSGSFGGNLGYFPPAPSSLQTSSSPTQKEHSSDSSSVSRPVQQRTVSSGSNTSTSSRPPLHAAGLESALHLNIPRPSDMPGPVDLTTDAARFSQSARSGMLIQSPDGMPMGMFFDPAPRQPGSRRLSTRSDATGSDRRRGSVIARPSIATYNSSIDGILKSSTSSGSRHSRAASLAEVSHTTSLSRRDTTSRRSPASEPQHSPLDRPEATSPNSTRSSRVKTAGAGGVAPGVLTHRPSSGTPQPAGPRIPNAEGLPVLGAAGLPPSTSPSALPMSPPRVPVPEDELEHAAPAALPPPAKKEKKARKSVKEEGVVVPPINVLIVEDNPINQTILSTFMKKRKIKYGVAKDGVEAVDKWRTGGFHLILMDIQLPVMDGIEATREIRRLEKSQNIGIFPSTPSSEVVRTPSPAKEVPPASPFRSSVIIVALTASSLQSDRVSALAAGCNDFLTKPVSLKWLEKKIVEWGCMQALIDFDGWRRWRGADKGEADAARGFDVQAKALRSRLRIDRRPPRSTSSVSVSGTATPPMSELESVASPAAATGPSINVTQPTPGSLASPAIPEHASDNNTPVNRPPSPVADSRVAPETQATVPIAGVESLAQQLEDVRLEQQAERSTVLQAHQSSEQSIKSVMLDSTPRGELPRSHAG